MNIRSVPLDDRPIEILISLGPSYLSNSELLAILIRTGTKEYNAIEVSINLLNNIGSLSNLKDININTLIKVKGIGYNKASTILAALELFKRVYLGSVKTRVKLSDALSIYNYTKYLFNSIMQEEFYCLYFNNKQELISIKLLFKGTINRTEVHPREIFKEAFLESASRIVCMHNHPSGSIKPSSEDILFTNNIVLIGKTCGIPVVDHIIVGDNSFFSFYEENMIK